MAMLTASDRALIKLLNELIELDFDALHAYETAIQRLDDLPSREQLREFLGDHARHTRDLGYAVSALGGEPVARGDTKQLLPQGRAQLSNMSGDAKILSAMKANEDELNRAYERATEEDLPAHLRALINANLQDERRHRTWIERRLRLLQTPRATSPR